LYFVLDKSCVWARLDRKLTKDASKRLKGFNRKKSEWLKENLQVSYLENHWLYTIS